MEPSVGLSGKPLLRASVQTGPNLRRLSISMKPPKSPTLGSIQVVNRNDGNPRVTMQIRAKNDQYYGELMETGGMRFVLARSGSTPPEVLSVHFDTEQN